MFKLLLNQPIPSILIKGTQGGKYIVKKNMLICVPDFDPSNTKESPNYQPVDFGRTPYRKLEFLPTLQSALGQVLPDPVDVTTEDSISFLKEQCEKMAIVFEQSTNPAPKLLDKLFSKLVEPELQGH